MSFPVFTAAANDVVALRQSLVTKPFLVVGLCAAWCNTCSEFREGFAEVAATRDDATFVWLDIEDDAELAGDIDVENFPTIGVFHQSRLLHFGVSLPQPAMLSRLLNALSTESRTVPAEAAIIDLPHKLATAAAAT